MTDLLKMPKYEAYKDSGVEWLNNIPEHWELIRMKYLYQDTSIKNYPTATLLSVTQDKGVVPRSWVETRMVMPSGNLESFKYIKEGDFAISLRSFEGGLEYCHHDGIISPAYTVLKAKRSDLVKGYYKYLFKSQTFISELQTSVVGIREGKNISYEELQYSLLPIPKPEEQSLIANFLDKKTAQIDEAVAIKKQQVELLKERKKVIIQQAVIRGLSPVVTMKDSGINWVDKIPSNWDVIRFKNLFTQSRLPVRKGDGVVTSFRDGQVTLRSNRRLTGFTEAVIEGGYQGIQKGQLVLNSMDAFEGAIGVSDSDGKCTPEYVICDPKANNVSQHYFAYLLREMALAKYIQVICNAVRQRAVRIRFNNLATRFMVVPPLEEQEKIVQHIQNESKKIDSGIAHLRSQIEKFKEYKTTLINSAVTGEIKVPLSQDNQE
nr:restriction endonuclease subunit S [Moritella viscosa]SHO18094.1 Putative type I site-specific restriction-modification system, S subunit [Moritella viscosa]